MAKTTVKKTATWVVLGLLFVGLIGFGTSNLGGHLRTIGSVGGEDIAVQDYTREMRAQIRAFDQQTGQSLPFSQYQALGLDRLVLQRLVATRTLDAEAADLGLSVGDARVAAEIRSQPQFQGESGTFDREAYAFALGRNGLTEREFEERLRDDLTRALLQGAVTGGIPAPETYGRTVAAFLEETRAFLWTELAADDLAEPLPEPTEDELRAFHEANTDAFMRPAQKQITYAALTPEMVVGEVELDEDTLRALYEQRIDEFVVPERRLVERLVFPAEDEAQAAADRIAAGESDFDAVVTARGLELGDIDLGDVTEDDLEGAGPAVFAAEAGDIVGPLESPFGPALYRVNAVLQAQDVPFEEARDDLGAELRAEQAQQLIDEAVAGMADLVAGGAQIEDLAERTPLELGTLSYDETSAEGLAAYAAFREAAEAASPGDFAEVVRLEDGGAFALRVDAESPAEPIPFEQVRDDVARAWRADETKSRLMDRAETLAEAAAETGRFPEAAPAPTAETGIDRRAFVPGAPAGLIPAVFDLAEGETTVIETASGAIVALLTDIARPEEPTQDQVAAMTEEARTGVTQDIFDVFTDALQTRTEVRIDQAALDAVNASFQ